MDVCAKCGVIVEPGATGILRACEQKDGTLFCVACDVEVWFAEREESASGRDVQAVQRRVA